MAEPVPVASGAPFPLRPWKGVTCHLAWAPEQGDSVPLGCDALGTVASGVSSGRAVGKGGPQRAGVMGLGGSWKPQRRRGRWPAVWGWGVGRCASPRGGRRESPAVARFLGIHSKGGSSPGGKAGLGLHPPICRDPAPEGCGGSHLPRPPPPPWPPPPPQPPPPVTATSTAGRPGPCLPLCSFMLVTRWGAWGAGRQEPWMPGSSGSRGWESGQVVHQQQHVPYIFKVHTEFRVWGSRGWGKGEGREVGARRPAGHTACGSNSTYRTLRFWALRAESYLVSRSVCVPGVVSICPLTLRNMSL